MYLINTKSFRLEYFERPPDEYAILSHTWGAEEVTHREYIAQDQLSKVKSGYKKIEYLCHQAQQDNFEYAWIDTVCIDKSSSAELSEAINSMFAWYKWARVCYVYLSDVTSRDEMKTSRWFSRGWTLQELIAPEVVQFYTTDWKLIGNKVKLAESLAEWTYIERIVLKDRSYLQKMSTYTKMSWAAHRKTTRIEDMAYCLLGLFNINMPLLYGEGHKAFVRLQEEIIRTSYDESILAWDRPSHFPTLRVHNPFNSSFLAPSVEYFSPARKVLVHESYQKRMQLSPSRNLKMQVQLLRVEKFAFSKRGFSKDREYWAILNCRFERKFAEYVGLQLENLLSLGLEEESPLSTLGSSRLRSFSQKDIAKLNSKAITLRGDDNQPNDIHPTELYAFWPLRSVCRPRFQILERHRYTMSYGGCASNFDSTDVVSDVLAEDNISLHKFVFINRSSKQALMVSFWDRFSMDDIDDINKARSGILIESKQIRDADDLQWLKHETAEILAHNMQSMVHALSHPKRSKGSHVMQLPKDGFDFWTHEFPYHVGSCYSSLIVELRREHCGGLDRFWTINLAKGRATNRVCLLDACTLRRLIGLFVKNAPEALVFTTVLMTFVPVVCIVVDPWGMVVGMVVGILPHFKAEHATYLLALFSSFMATMIIIRSLFALRNSLIYCPLTRPSNEDFNKTDRKRLKTS